MKPAWGSIMIMIMVMGEYHDHDQQMLQVFVL